MIPCIKNYAEILAFLFMWFHDATYFDRNHLSLILYHKDFQALRNKLRLFTTFAVIILQYSYHKNMISEGLFNVTIVGVLKYFKLLIALTFYLK